MWWLISCWLIDGNPKLVLWNSWFGKNGSLKTCSFGLKKSRIGKYHLFKIGPPKKHYTAIHQPVLSNLDIQQHQEFVSIVNTKQQSFHGSMQSKETRNMNYNDIDQQNNTMNNHNIGQKQGLYEW